MTTRTLAWMVLLPVAVLIGFAAGRASAEVGIVAEAWSPDARSALVVERRFAFGPADRRLVLRTPQGNVELRALAADVEVPEMIWSPDGSLTGAVLGGVSLAVVDPSASRLLYELPLVEPADGSRVARGVGFSANALAITFDDCPGRGAGCRPRFMALPTR